jgi:DmsE family decaheme c-type cytochrome
MLPACSRPWLVGIALAWVAAATSAGASPGRPGTIPGHDASRQQTAPAAQAAGYVGADTCATCHEAAAKSYLATPHGRAANPRSPAAVHACETCHGPGKAHVDGGGDPTKIITFANMAPAKIDEVCTRCHDRGAHADWDGSVHDRHNLSCTTCHSVHDFKSPAGQLKTAAIVDTCRECHKREFQKTRQISHMPLLENKMTCTSCHNPHGSTNVRLLRAGNSLAEACTSCHAAQRGPFLWEHAPTRERCTTCHDPHGSPNDRMLVAKLPMLCQRCHISTRHPSTIYDLAALNSSSGNRISNRG